MRVVIAAIAALLLTLPTSATAQEDTPPEGAMLIILDASGSMNRVDEDGVPFIDKAKDAVLQLIQALPDDMQVGLRVYGHREPNTDAERGCVDTELVAPVAPLDRAAIRDAIEGVDASGFTPIGLSLEEAAADLPESGTRSIVLISDGEDTCAPPDPCQVAEELYGESIDVRIESVGFLIDTGSAAEQQLRCIAEATGGRYTAVGRADDLVARLGEVGTAILEWRPPFNGALDPALAPEIPLMPKADWVTDEPGKIAVTRWDGVLMPGETRWYHLDLWEREGVWVWADLGWPPDLEAGGEFETIILDEAGNRVETGVGHGGYPVRIELPGGDSPMTGATVRPPEQGWPSQASYLVGLHWEAPPEVFLGSLHVDVEVTNGDAVRYEQRIEIEGSLDPQEAPALALAGLEENGPGWRGSEFRGPLASGETRWYRLDLERGEIMNVFALFPGDRYVGDGTEGEFAIVLTDGDGEPVGKAFDEWPQMEQGFGAERHQATVSGTTSSDPDPVPETVLVGFRWEGPPGQESEIRFETEAMFDPHRKQMADAIEEETQAAASTSDEAEPEVTTTEAATTTTAPSTTAVAAGDESGGESTVPAVIIVAAVALAIAAVVVAFLVRRSRAG